MKISVELYNRLTGARTYDELMWAFARVSNDDDWTAPIDAYVPRELKKLVGQAIDFFTATEASFELDKKSGLLHVTAIGYRKGPAGGSNESKTTEQVNG